MGILFGVAKTDNKRHHDVMIIFIYDAIHEGVYVLVMNCAQKSLKISVWH